MKIYFYCSYTRSPVGFRLGMIDTNDVCGEICKLSGEKIHPFIWKCFSQGSIRKACGLIPDTLEENSQYFMLVKSKNPVVKDKIEYFINFAFVTNQKAEYESWIRGNPQDENKLLQSICDTIILDGTSEFGFTVCRAELNTLINNSYCSIFNGFPVSSDAFYAEAVLPKDDPEQLLNILGLTEFEVKRLRYGNWFSIKKKQKIISPWMIVAITSSVVVALFTILNSLD